MSSDPLISLVSGTYNRLPLLRQMVQSFRDNLPVGMTYEVVLVDGGSTDGTLEWAREQADVRLIEHGALRGAIRAFTDGANAAHGKYVLLSNDDVEFFPGSIVPAIVHLETTPKCGAVAYADNRPLLPQYTDKDYKVLRMPAINPRGGLEYVVYAQVGLFRKWLGDEVGWWGADGAMVDAKVYGGDNHLSAHIWRLGYSVDPLPPCKVHDSVIDDDLRAHNRPLGQHDSNQYYGQWPGDIKGAQMPEHPLVDQMNQEAARILYLPIYEPGWEVQKHPIFGKRGLRDALSRYRNNKGEASIVYELDYMSIEPRHLQDRLVEIVTTFKPHLMLTQIQSAAMGRAGDNVSLATVLQKTRQAHPYMAVVNWNGDQAIGGLKSAEIMQVLRFVDLQLTVSADVYAFYEQMGVKHGYWQISYEDVPDEQLPDYENAAVVFLASLRSTFRRELAELIRHHKGKVYSPGDGTNTLYNFGAGKAIYRGAKLAISDNEFPNSYGFVSNRLFQALSAGNALVLQQKVQGLDELTGLVAGKHYVEWTDLNHLNELIAYYLDPAHEKARARIAKAGTAYIRKHHNFDVRVRELFEHIKRTLGVDKQLVETVELEYIGRATEPFGAGYGRHTGMHYEYQPGHKLLVHKLDAPGFLENTHLWKTAEA